MTRGPTFSELVWPEDSAARNLANEWARASAFQILDWTWRAFDALAAKHLSKVDFTQTIEQLERDLVRHHFVEIQILFARETDGYSSLIPFHEWPEMETRSTASAKPPAYDLAFVAVANQRWAWPLEAKVIPTPGTLAEYLKDVNGKFVGGVASPMIGEGAMIAYLLLGSGEVFLQNVEAKLAEALSPSTDFPTRLHRTSQHIRSTAPDLSLHHIVMTMESASQH